MDSRITTTTSGLLIPAGQALLSGCFVGLASWPLGELAGWQQPGLIALALGLVVAAFSWAHLLRRWLSIVEALSGIEEQAPAQAPEVVRVLVSDQDHYTTGTYANLPASVDQLARLGEGLVEGVSPAESNWIGRGRPFSRGQWGELRAEMIKRRLWAWVDPAYPQAGLELTPAGRAAARTFAALSPTPSLTLSARNGNNRQR